MDDVRVMGEIDLISASDVTALARVDGPCVSVLMPTHRFGRETLQGPIRLRNLVEEAEQLLRNRGSDATIVDGILAPARALVDDAPFWQHQGNGLALFTAPGEFRRFRLPLAFDEEVTVGASFRVRPLMSLLHGDGTFFVLALSQNTVRLFQATRHTIAALDAGPMPTSIDEALAFEEAEAQLQYRSVGGDAAQFHGHGVGAEVEKAALERFFRAVDRGLVERVGKRDDPLVLACVDYYLPIYRSVSRYPNVLDVAVTGNPDRTLPQELHAAAWSLIERRIEQHTEREIARYHDARGGKAVATIEAIVTQAREGRVESLFVAPGPALWGRVDSVTGTVTRTDHPSPLDEDLVDRAVLDTLMNGGRVLTAAPEVLDGAVAAALLRY